MSEKELFKAAYKEHGAVVALEVMKQYGMANHLGSMQSYFKDVVKDDPDLVAQLRKDIGLPTKSGAAYEEYVTYKADKTRAEELAVAWLKANAPNFGLDFITIEEKYEQFISEREEEK